MIFRKIAKSGVTFKFVFLTLLHLVNGVKMCKSNDHVSSFDQSAISQFANVSLTTRRRKNQAFCLLGMARVWLVLPSCMKGFGDKIADCEEINLKSTVKALS